MKIFLTILLSLATTLVSQAGYAQAAKPMAPNPSCLLDEDNLVSWSNCDGQSVTVNGRSPEPLEIMQHPMLDGPQLLVAEADGSFVPKSTVQSYMNVSHRQIILLSNAYIECDGNLEVEGTLETISLGGPPGTKGSYKGWSIRVNEYQCSTDGK